MEIMSEENALVIKKTEKETIENVKPFLNALSSAKAVREEEGRLMEAARGGDNRAFDALLAPYREPALRYAYAIVKDMDDAEDVVQEAFLGVFLCANKYRKGTPFKRWLMGMVRRKGLLCIRMRRREGEFKNHYAERSRC